MRTATISEAKEHLEELIAAARAGEPVEITADAGETVASLVAPMVLGEERATSDLEIGWEQRLIRLESRGLVSRSRGGPKPEFPRIAEPVLSSGVLDALLEERREGR